MLVPDVLERQEPNLHDLKAFYEYHSILWKPWDGPATLLFLTVVLPAGMLDRNGLRPARYLITPDDLMVVASETGVLSFEPSQIREKGRLKPARC
jgi:glutamate synthase (NADPH/NADH) large chain